MSGFPIYPKPFSAVNSSSVFPPSNVRSTLASHDELKRSDDVKMHAVLDETFLSTTFKHGTKRKLAELVATKTSTDALAKTDPNVSLTYLGDSKVSEQAGKILFSISKETQEDCNRLGLNLNRDQLSIVSGLAQEAFATGSEFTNVKKARFPTLPKMHVFWNKDENRVEVFLKGEPNQPKIEGVSKDFSKRFSLVFSIHHYPRVVKVAALRGNLAAAIEHKRIHNYVGVWDGLIREVDILKIFKGKANNICQLRNFAKYLGSTGTGKDKKTVEKFIMYFDLYDGSMSALAEKYPEKFRNRDFVLKIFENSLKALAEIHKAGIIHQDIKPDNIFVNEDGEVFFGDFGSSGKQPDPKRTVRGSLPYLAPEKFFDYESDKRDVSNEIGIKPGMCGFPMDVWSLGILFYSLYLKLTSLKPIGEFPEHPITTVATLFNWPHLKSGEVVQHSTENQWAAIKLLITAAHKEEFPKNDPMRALIWSMLRPNPDDRISVIEALKFLNDHIIDKKPFLGPVKKAPFPSPIPNAGKRAVTPQLIRLAGNPNEPNPHHPAKGRRCSFLPEFLTRILVG